jgi:mono/diheme cytochrome c family protein
MFKTFVNGFQVVVGLAALVTVVLLLTVSPTEAEVENPDTLVGGGLFQASCAGCHGAEGEGGVGPALAGGVSRFDSVQEVAGFISAGVPGRMPGFETRLHPDQVNAIAQHVWTDLAGR